MGYSRSKTLATIGQGNLEVGDKENSDELTRLNRDTSKVNKELYSGSTGTSVSAMLDHRLLSEEGRKQIKQDIATTIDALDTVNRYVKDKVGGYELTPELKEQIEQKGFEKSLADALREKGVSEEKIQEVLANENVKILLSGIQEQTDTPNDSAKTQITQEGIVELSAIYIKATKDLQEYLVDGAQGINAIVNIVGEDNAAVAILVAQVAIQGTVKTAASMIGDEVKNIVFGGMKDSLSNYIADDVFEVKNGGWDSSQQNAIYGISDISADFGVDVLISEGAFGIIKGAKNLGKASENFEGSVNTNGGKTEIIQGAKSIDDTANQIAQGHAWDKHKSNFPELKSKEDFAQYIDSIIKNPSESKELSNGRKAFWDDTSGTVVIKDPKNPDGGTAFKPSSGKRYFNDKLK